MSVKNSYTSLYSGLPVLFINGPKPQNVQFITTYDKEKCEIMLFVSVLDP